MRKIRLGHGVILLVVVALLAGCSQPLSTREKGTLVGGGIGGATGAIIGAAVGAPGVGAAIGTAVGAGAGALVGDRMQKRDTEITETQQQITQQQKDIARNQQIIEE